MLSDRSLLIPPEAQGLVQRLEDLWNLGDEKMTGQHFQTNNDLRNVLLLQFSAAASRTTQAALTQIKNGTMHSLDFLLRPLIEGVITYKWILGDPTQMRARAYIVDDIRSRLANIRRLIPLLERNQAPGMATVTDATRYRELEAQLVTELRDFETRYGRDNLRLPNIEERARLGGSDEIYATAYWLLCQDTHLTVRGLDRYMTDNNGQLGITWDVDFARFQIAVRSFYITLSAFFGECSNTFGTPAQSDLAPFKDIP